MKKLLYFLLLISLSCKGESMQHAIIHFSSESFTAENFVSVFDGDSLVIVDHKSDKTVNISLKEDKILKLRFDKWQEHLLYVSPGDTISIEFDGDDIINSTNSIKLTGGEERVNDILNNSYKHIARSSGDELPWFNQPHTDFSQKIAADHRYALDITNYLYDIRPEDDFKTLISDYLTCTVEKNYFRYPRVINTNFRVPYEYSRDYLSSYLFDSPNSSCISCIERDREKLMIEYSVEKAHFVNDSKELYQFLTYSDVLTDLNDQYLRRSILGSILYKASKENLEYVRTKIHDDLDDGSAKTKMIARLDDISETLLNDDTVSFEVLDKDFSVITSDQYKGKYLLIDFWATWCSPCIAEKKILDNELAQLDYQDKLVILNVSLDRDQDKWINYMKTHELIGNNVIADGSFDSKIAKMFNVSSIPRYVLLDRDHKVIDYNTLDFEKHSIEELLTTME